MMTVNDNKNGMETETLYIHYRRAMYMAAVSVVRNHELAEDAVQEVFLRLMDDPARLRGYPCAENRAYLLRAVRGAALNLLRRRNREAELDESHACPTSTEDAIISHMGYSRLVDMIRALPPCVKRGCHAVVGRRSVCLGDCAEAGYKARHGLLAYFKDEGAAEEKS